MAGKARSRAMAEPEGAVSVKLDTATVEYCIEAVRRAAVVNNAEEAGRASAEAALRRLVE